jgi:hypothetical protein
VKIIKTKAGEYALVACLVFVVWPTLAGLGLRYRLRVTDGHA